jgi:hypothetical protein
MAAPKTHFKWTLGLIIIYAVSVIFLFNFGKKSLVEIIAIIFFGFLIDGDHVSSLKLSRIRDKSWLEEKDWVNWLHTEEGLLISLLTSLWMRSWWPVISFAVHIAVDSRNRVLAIKPDRSPLPASLLPLWPHKLTYEYGQ